MYRTIREYTRQKNDNSEVEIDEHLANEAMNPTIIECNIIF